MVCCRRECLQCLKYILAITLQSILEAELSLLPITAVQTHKFVCHESPAYGSQVTTTLEGCEHSDLWIDIVINYWKYCVLINIQLSGKEVNSIRCQMP